METITLSTCEAEYMASCSAIPEANFLRQLYQNMKGDQVEINIYANNESTIGLAKIKCIIKHLNILT